MTYLMTDSELKNTNNHVEINEEKLKKILELSEKENLIIIGDSQKGKTTLLKKMISSIKNNFLLIDTHDEISTTVSIPSVKNKNGLYHKDYDNEVTKFAIQQTSTKDSIQTIIYDDFYGYELTEIVRFLEGKEGRNVILTVNHKEVESGLKMILKTVYYNKDIPYNPYELELIQKHFNKVLYLGTNYNQFFNLKVIDDEVFFENL